jgi:AcrR family transcriptional regulator
MAHAPAPRLAMLLSAIRLFRRQGYEKTSMLDVVRESGGPRGSLYHYFPGGKVEMGCEAVTLAGKGVLAWIERARARSGTPAAFLRALGESYRSALLTSDFEEGCPVATVALETTPGELALAQACGAAFETWISAVRDALVEKGVARAKARDLAPFAVSAIEGAILLARTRRSAEPIRVAIQQLVRLLD